MKNSLKLFSLSIVLSIASISGFANNPEKNYIDSENIILIEERIYLLSEEDHLEPLTAIYSDEKGLYILSQDESESTEQTPLYTLDAQDRLVQFINQEPLCTEDAYRELTDMPYWECFHCSEINGRLRTYCKNCSRKKFPAQ
ncbi:MAG: hypothetical protein ACRCU0_03305 [Candidatus Rhabdochlamydia sp.]